MFFDPTLIWVLLLCFKFASVAAVILSNTSLTVSDRQSEIGPVDSNHPSSGRSGSRFPCRDARLRNLADCLPLSGMFLICVGALHV